MRITADTSILAFARRHGEAVQLDASVPPGIVVVDGSRISVHPEAAMFTLRQNAGQALLPNRTLRTVAS